MGKRYSSWPFLRSDDLSLFTFVLWVSVSTATKKPARQRLPLAVPFLRVPALDAIVISTGVAIDNEFGASPKVHTQIGDGKPLWDRAVLALQGDSKTLAFRSHNGIGGTEMLFAKKYIVTVESYGKRVVGMEFGLPSDSSAILRYCGLMKPKVSQNRDSILDLFLIGIEGQFCFLPNSSRFAFRPHCWLHGPFFYGFNRL